MCPQNKFVSTSPWFRWRWRDLNPRPSASY